MERLAGRTAFITGGAQGIGLGIARALAREGVKLALADVDTGALAKAQAELARHTPTEAVVLDVRDRDRYAAVADRVESQLGPVTLLFNNAGVAGSISPSLMTYEMWDWVIGINLNGVINGIQTFVPRMIKRGGAAHIVNTSSGAGLVAFGSGFLYATSKYAVVGLSESLRSELAHHGIDVSVLCPGPVATDIVTNTDRQRPEGAQLSTRVATKREQAKAVLSQGTAADAVGEMVVDAIRANRLYIFTDTMMVEPIHWRTQALLDAVAEGKPVDDRSGGGVAVGGA